jgi:hypothetical protein
MGRGCLELPSPQRDGAFSAIQPRRAARSRTQIQSGKTAAPSSPSPRENRSSATSKPPTNSRSGGRRSGVSKAGAVGLEPAVYPHDPRTNDEFNELKSGCGLGGTDQQIEDSHLGQARNRVSRSPAGPLASPPSCGRGPVYSRVEARARALRTKLGRRGRPPAGTPGRRCRAWGSTPGALGGAPLSSSRSRPLGCRRTRRKAE